MYRAGVIGDSQTIMGFRAIGLTTIAARDAVEAREALAKLVKSNHAVIYIIESLVQLIAEEIAKYNNTPEIAIIPIPSREGIIGIGQRGLHEAVEKAVGADILRDN